MKSYDFHPDNFHHYSSFTQVGGLARFFLMINMATWIKKMMKLYLKSHSVFYSRPILFSQKILSKCFPLKFRYSEKASKVWNNLPLSFDVYLSNFQTKWEIFSNYVAFSQYLNFITVLMFHKEVSCEINMGK